MKKVTLINLLLIFVMIPATLWLGTQLTGRWYYLTSTLIIIETMLPFSSLLKQENHRHGSWSLSPSCALLQWLPALLL